MWAGIFLECCAQLGVLMLATRNGCAECVHIGLAKQSHPVAVTYRTLDGLASLSGLMSSFAPRRWG